MGGARPNPPDGGNVQEKSIWAKREAKESNENGERGGGAERGQKRVTSTEEGAPREGKKERENPKRGGKENAERRQGERRREKARAR